MPRRSYALVLEVDGDEIFYHWNYNPEVPNCGGGVGVLLPGDQFYDLTYDELFSLGEGTHMIDFDETVLDVEDVRATVGRSDDDILFRRFRYGQFCHRAGVYTSGERHCETLLAFTPENAHRIVPRLSPEETKELTDYASRIPESLLDRSDDEFFIFSSGAGTIPIPDENLYAIRHQFAERA